MSSVIIAGLPMRVKRWPACTITPNVTWIETSAATLVATDRGQAGDRFDLEMTVFGTKQQMEAFATWAQDYRGQVVQITSVDGFLFPPVVDQSVPVTGFILSRGRMQRSFFSYGSGVDEVTFTFRAIAPALTGTPSLSRLLLQHQFEHDQSTPVLAHESQAGVIFSDRRDDVGRFVGSFLQTNSEAADILRFLLGPGRSTAFPFPALPIGYPFGKSRGNGPFGCCVTAYTVARHSLGLWNIQITFTEDPGNV